MADKLAPCDDPDEIPELLAAVAELRGALAAAPAGHPDRALYLHDLSLMLHTLAQRTGAIDWLREALSTGQDAVVAAAAVPETHPVQVDSRVNRRNVLASWFAVTDEVADLRKLVEADRALIAAAPAEHPDRVAMLYLLWTDLAALGERVPEPGLLNEIADAARAAVAAIPADDENRPGALADLAGALLGVFERSQNTALLGESVRIARHSLRELSVDNPFRAQLLTALWNGITMADPRNSETAEIFRIVEDIELLGEIVSDARAIMAVTPPTHSEHAEVSHRLCQVLRVLAERTGDLALYIEIVQVSRAGLGAAETAEEFCRALMLDRLFGSMALLDSRHGHVSKAQLDRAARATVTAFPSSVPTVADLLAMSHGLRTLVDNAADETALRRAVHAGRLLLESLSVDDPRRAEQLRILSALLQFLFEQSREPLVVEDPVRLGREACTAGDPGASSDLLLNLGLALQQHSEATTELAVLQEAVRVWREIISHTAESAELQDYRVTYVNLLKRLLAETADINVYRELRRTLDELDRDVVNPIATLVTTAMSYAIDSEPDLVAVQDKARWARQILATDSLSPSDRATVTTGLGMLLMVTGHHIGDRRMLEDAVRVTREAVTVFPSEDPDRPVALLNHVFALVTLYDTTDDLDDLREAVRIGRHELATLPEETPDRATYLSIVATALSKLAERTGDQVARQDAMHLGRTATRTSDRDGLMHAGVLAPFDQILGDSHRANGDRSLAEEAVQVARDAAAAAPADVHGYYGLLNSLGNNLLLLYDRSNDRAHLTESIAVHRAAVAACPSEHPDLLKLQINLSNSLSRSFQLDNDSAALEEAIRLCREVAASNVDAAPLRQAYVLSILANHLRHQFYATFDTSIGHECLQLRRQAISLTPRDHANWVRYQGLLGTELAQRLMLTQDRRLLPEALSALRLASASAVAPISQRIAAARLLEFAEASAGNRAKALAAMELVVELLPRVATRALVRSDREYLLGQQSGHAAAAAAAAVTMNLPQRAVELLEQCRGILLGEAMDDRHELTELSATAPALAAELADLRNQLILLEDATPHGLSAPDQADLAAANQRGDRRRALTERWVSLLEQVRTLPGFDRFLLPPDIDALRHHALDGPIVMLFAYLPPAGGHALIVPADPNEPIRAVPLPQLTAPARIEQLKRLDDIVNGEHRSLATRTLAEKQLHELLEWLWDAIAGPVLKALSITEPTDELPRVWWCPVGDLAFLPIQAAGYHRVPGARTVLDRTVSSFTTTLRTLGHNRDRTIAPQNSAVLISMPHTTGAKELHRVSDEVAEIAALLTDPQILQGSAATKSSVSAALPEHSIAHFACHAVDDPAEPSHSRLLLHDHETQPFTVGTLIRLHLKNAELAYLSACSTTRTTPLLADEAIHLTATIHLAGYRHVIGTLWPINDRAAENIAVDFYRQLTDNGRSPSRTELSALALNRAVRLERDRHPSSPSRWAAHLHHGV
ncbi:MAG: hypothetical protein JWN03_863 [Nocardia sp.]|uniref:CHAT domain-containing protein n=1 Tax=Nocardia sp. TaxID=1821 RepID=UPI00261DD5C5|nr:CHAT domain-containing protein [Nocardia sp.]MCU1640588.1 hypothetical protein [Nocardia sp.]